MLQPIVEDSLESDVLSPTAFDSFLRGDPRIFAAITHVYGVRLFRSGLRLTGDPDAAHDLAQKTWLLVHQKRSLYERRGSFWAWVYTIFRRIARDIWRADKRRIVREQYVIDETYCDLWSHAPVQDPHDILEEQERRLGVLRAVDSLPPRQRQAVLLRYFDDYSVQEVAQTMGVANGTVKATLSAALQKLSTVLSPITNERGSSFAD